MRQQGFRCRRCRDEIYSNSRHDLVFCKCGAIFIDGGFDYVRGGGELSNIERIEREVDRRLLPARFRR